MANDPGRNLRVPSWSAAEAIAWALDGEGDWKAEHDGLGEIIFTDESGQRFRITVDEIQDEDEE